MAGPPPKFAPLLRTSRGYLAMIAADGGPRVLPVCFTWAGDVIWTAIDGKPKTEAQPQRIRAIQANPKVSFIVDRWDDNWERLAWLQARGSAMVLAAGPESDRARHALREKYPQYAITPLEGPVIRIDVARWIGWSGSPASR
ncbi:MAG: TIGR03668 family PPOX class F420-dependent oxidoreductase [Actinomycetota bacterium]